MRNETRRRRWSRRRAAVIVGALSVAMTFGIGSTWTLERYVLAHVALAEADASDAAADPGG